MTLGLRESRGAVIVGVHAQPGARRDEVVGWHDGRIKVRVTAAPEGGRANRAVERLLAAALGVAPSSVTIVAGATSRRKDVALEGLTVEEVRSRLAVLLDR